MNIKFLSIKDVCAATSFSRATVYRQVKQGTFPAPKQLSSRRVGWRADEVEAWNAERK